MKQAWISLSGMLGLLVAVVPLTASAGGDVEKRLELLERRVAHISELVLEVEGLKRSSRELLGRVEELQHRLDRMEQKQRELYLDLDQRISALQAGSAAQPVAVPPAESSQAGQAPGKEAVTEVSSASPEQIQAEYDAAYRLLQPSQRKYKEAIAAFTAFLDKYPGCDLADNALYWLGETYYVTEDNASALEAFDRLLAEYPHSDKAPGAMLKKGYILDAMGRRQEAAAVLQKLVKEYPDASVSRMAKARLSKLGKG